MKSLHEQDHYEILDVPRSAEAAQIERAYRIAQSAYAERGLATYSVFDDVDSGAIRDRLETAYRVLSNEEAREAYDRSMGPIRTEEARMETAAAPLSDRWVEAAGAGEPELSTPSAVFQELESDVEEQDGTFDGAMLRRARLRRGIELDGISDITKVSVTNLQNIEDDNFDELPAPVYVRGFVSAYAQVIGLEPKRVASSYVARFEASREGKGGSRLLGRG